MLASATCSLPGFIRDSEGQRRGMERVNKRDPNDS
jgi:hypothetical protein